MPNVIFAQVCFAKKALLVRSLNSEDSGVNDENSEEEAAVDLMTPPSPPPFLARISSSPHGHLLYALSEL